MSLGSLAPETGISTAGGTQASEVPTERPGSGGGPDPAHSDAGNGLGGFSSKPPTSPGKPQVLAVTPWPAPSCPGSLWPLLAPSSLPPGPVPGPLCKFFFSLREPWEKFLSPFKSLSRYHLNEARSTGCWPIHLTLLLSFP